MEIMLNGILYSLESNYYDDDFGYYDDTQSSVNYDINADDADAWSLTTIVFPVAAVKVTSMKMILYLKDLPIKMIYI